MWSSHLAITVAILRLITCVSVLLHILVKSSLSKWQRLLSQSVVDYASWNVAICFWLCLLLHIQWLEYVQSGYPFQKGSFSLWLAVCYFPDWLLWEEDGNSHSRVAGKLRRDLCAVLSLWLLWCGRRGWYPCGMQGAVTLGACCCCCCCAFRAELTLAGCHHGVSQSWVKLGSPYVLQSFVSRKKCWFWMLI